MRRGEIKRLPDRSPPQRRTYAGHQTARMTIWKEFMPPKNYKAYIQLEYATVGRKTWAAGAVILFKRQITGGAFTDRQPDIMPSAWAHRRGAHASRHHQPLLRFHGALFRPAP